MSHKATTHLSLRVSPEDLETLDTLAAARGFNGRGARAAIVRALIAHAADRVDEQADDGKPAIADEDEVHQLLTDAARNGNVAAMHELRMLLRTDQEAAARRAAATRPKDTRTDFEKLDDQTASDELAARRGKHRRKRARVAGGGA